MSQSYLSDNTQLSQHQWVYDTIQRHREALESEAKGWRKIILAYWSRWAEEDQSVLSGLDDLDPDSHPMLIGVNYLFAFVDSLIAAVAPVNPRATVKARRSQLESVADFRQALINEVWRKQKLGAKGRKLVGRTALFGRCFLKQVWDSKRRMPKYRVVRPHNVYFDDKAEEWEDLRYIGEIVPLTRGQFDQRLRKQGKKGGKYKLSEKDLEQVKFSEYPGWLTDDAVDEGGEVHRNNYQWVVVYEHYDLIARKFYHYVDGVNKPIYEGPLPYALVDNPFSLLTFNDNMVNLRGLSDAALIYPTLDRLNELASLELWHVKAAIPVPVIHEGLLDDPEEFEEQLANVSGPGDAIRLSAPMNVKIQDVLGATPTVQLPIEWQAVRAALVTAIELVTGMPGFMRGQGAPGDVATQSALSADSFNDRTNIRQKQLYELFSENAKKTSNLFAEYMEEEDSLPVRLLEDSESFKEIDRRALGYGAVQDPCEDSPWDFDYDVYPYNAAEENDLVMLKRALEAAPMFQNSPVLNQERFLKWLMGLLGAPQNLVNSQSEMQAQAPAMPGAPGMEATPPGADLGMEATMNPTAAAVQGGEVGVVSGPASLSAGFESATPT